MGNRFIQRNSRDMGRRLGRQHQGISWDHNGFSYELPFDYVRNMMFDCMSGGHMSVTSPDDIPTSDVWDCIDYLQSIVDGRVCDMIQDFCDDNWDRWEGEKMGNRIVGSRDGGDVKRVARRALRKRAGFETYLKDIKMWSIFADPSVEVWLVIKGDYVNIRDMTDAEQMSALEMWVYDVRQEAPGRICVYLTD